MQSRRFLNLRDRTAIAARREKPKDSAQQDLSKACSFLVSCHCTRRLTSHLLAHQSRPRSSELLNFLSKSDSTKPAAKNGADNANSEKSEEDTKVRTNTIGFQMVPDLIPVDRECRREVIGAKYRRGLPELYSKDTVE